jgi:uncharacterized protein YjbI with pentapeptide repeats
MVALVGFSFFCVVTTLGASDLSLFESEPRIKAPLIDVTMSFRGFLLVAPIALIGITAYLHIFMGAWLEFETLRQTVSRQSDDAAFRIENLPTLFSLKGRTPLLLTAAIFYVLPPLVLATMTWKAAALWEPTWRFYMVALTSTVTVVLAGLWLWRHLRFGHLGRETPARVLAARIGALVVLAGLAAAQFAGGVQAQSPSGVANSISTPTCVGGLWLRRPLDFSGADLRGKWLRSVKLCKAYALAAVFGEADLRDSEMPASILQEADLRKANLSTANLDGATLVLAQMAEANLTDAKLRNARLDFAKASKVIFRNAKLENTSFLGANLRGADLRGADLSGANLQDADLQETKFRNAELQKAIFSGASLRGADLRGAHLNGAKLEGARCLTEAQVKAALIDASTQLPKLPSPCPPEEED